MLVYQRVFSNQQLNIFRIYYVYYGVYSQTLVLDQLLQWALQKLSWSLRARTLVTLWFQR